MFVGLTREGKWMNKLLQVMGSMIQVGGKQVAEQKGKDLLWPAISPQTPILGVGGMVG